jgi:hypothetical protein
MAIHRLVLAALLAVAPAVASAAHYGSGFDPQHLFLGAGVTNNELPNTDDGTGYQLFLGYNFGEVAPNIAIDGEFGYMDSGDMDRRGPPGDVRVEGFWANGVLRLIMIPGLELLGRAGYDFGDDDGLMVGFGIAFGLTPLVQMRLEYVDRDNLDSYQVNFVLRPY